MSNRKLENKLAEKWVKNLKLQVKEANEHINIFKIHGDKFQQRGISDYLGFYKGRGLAIEFKLEGEIPDEYQKVFLIHTNLCQNIGIWIELRNDGSFKIHRLMEFGILSNIWESLIHRSALNRFII